MSWRAVARLEAKVVRRSRGLRAVVAVAAVVGVAAVWLPSMAIGDGLGVDGAVSFLVAPLRLVVGLAGLLAGYGAVAAPRGAGQLKLTLGLPNRRSALVVGAFVGRASVVLAGVGVALGAATLAVALAHGSVPVRALAGLGGLLAVLGVSVTGLAVGISAASPSRAVAGVAAIGAFVVFEFFWGVVPAGTHYLVEGALPGAVVPPWVVLLERLQPFAAFEAASELVTPATEAGVRLSAGGAEAASVGTRSLADRVGGPVPIYLDPRVSLVTLAAWCVVPLWLGVVRFARADL